MLLTKLKSTINPRLISISTSSNISPCTTRLIQHNHTPFTIPQRSFGFFDTISKAVSKIGVVGTKIKESIQAYRSDDPVKAKMDLETKTVEEVSSKRFQEQIEELIKLPKYTIEQFESSMLKQYRELAEQVVKSNTGMISKMLPDDKKMNPESTRPYLEKYWICRALTPRERENFDYFNNASVERVSMALKVPKEHIEKFIDEFEQTKTFHAWVLKRHERKLPLPTSAVDIEKYFKDDPPELSKRLWMKLMKERMVKPKRRRVNRRF